MEIIISKDKKSLSLIKDGGETRAFQLYYTTGGVEYTSEGIVQTPLVELKNDNFEQELIGFGANAELIEEIKNSLND